MIGASRITVGMLAGLLAACVTVQPDVAGGLPQSIVYETGPCFGACPVYTVTVGADGQGLFEGRRFTTVVGERRFSVTPAQYRAFAEQLAPLRPANGSIRYDTPPACTQMATDMPSVNVTWRSGNGEEQGLYYYFGCDMEARRAMAERLRAAPPLLPIVGFIRTES
jgi:hypothetical protein